MDILRAAPILRQWFDRTLSGAVRDDDPDSMTRSRWPAAESTIIAAIVVASFGSLVWVHQWAVGACCGGDHEAELLSRSAMIACALLGVPVVLVKLIDARSGNPLLGSVAAGAGAAFVVVAASAASTLLIAMAISPSYDPGGFARRSFRSAYVGVLVVSLCAGLGAAWFANPRNGRLGSTVAIVVTLVLTAVAWGYLAIGSSEVNRCFVDDEFPLATVGECAGY